MAKPVDLELKQAFTEMQRKMMETTQKLKLNDLQISHLESDKSEFKKLLNELQELGDIERKDAKFFKSVGRAFVLSDYKEIKENSANEISNLDQKISKIQNNKKYLEASLTDSKRTLREMVEKRKK